MSEHTTFEQEAISIIKKLEVEKLEAERRVQNAQEVLTAKEEQVARWYAILKDYQEMSDLPQSEHDYRPSVPDEYSRLGPTEMVKLWANQHGGDVLVREVTDLALRVGIYKSRKSASNTFTNILKRHKDFVRIGPGHFHTRRNGQATLSAL